MRARAGAATPWPALGVILLLAFVLRAACAAYYIVTIDTEGSEYATLAASLLAGKGFLGKTIPGTYLVFPPLYPILIAAVAFVLQDVEVAGRAISVTMGSLLVVPVYFVARHVYEHRVALIAAGLVAIHPFLVEFSATVFSETTYVTLLICGVYWVLRGLRSGLARDMLIAGIILGFAYLARLEAIACVLIAFAFASACALAKLRESAAGRRMAMAGMLRAALMLAVFFAIAAPYIAFLYAQTGQLRFEAKSPLNYAMDRMILLEGAHIYDAAFRVDQQLNEQGVWNRTNLDIVLSTKVVPAEAAKILFYKARRVMPQQAEVLAAGSYIGSPFLFALALFGLFRKPWRGMQGVDQVLLLATASVGVIAMFGVYFVGARFFVVFMPFLLIWAANGAVELSNWVRETAQTGQFPWLGRLGPAVAGLACLGMVLLSLADARNVYEIKAFSRDNLPVRAAAEWIRRQPPEQKAVADSTSVIPFHSGATFIPFPFADSAVAMRYLHKMKVDFIVLKETEVKAGERTYLKEWWDRGPPDPGARLVHTARTPFTGELRVYRLPRKDGN